MPSQGATEPAVRPLRADAARNRTALLAAARTVFECDGYFDARVTDIAEQADLAHGSFYSHFTGKADILEAVLADVQSEMLAAGPSQSSRREGDPRGTIAAANRAYLEAYRRNAKLMALLEQVALVDKDFLALRLKRTDAFVKRNAKAIRHLQRDGHADITLDPDLTALAISTMISRTAYATLAISARPVDFELLVQTLTQLWTNALRIPPLDGSEIEDPALTAALQSDGEQGAATLRGPRR